MIFCGQCGADLRDTAVFCPGCGQRVAATGAGLAPGRSVDHPDRVSVDAAPGSSADPGVAAGAAPRRGSRSRSASLAMLSLIALLVFVGAALAVRLAGRDGGESGADRVTSVEPPSQRDDPVTDPIGGGGSSLVDDGPAPDETIEGGASGGETGGAETRADGASTSGSDATSTTTTSPSTTTTSITTTTTPAPTTTAPSPPPPTTVPGDLALVGIDMARPDCDNSYITIVASAIDPVQYEIEVSAALGRHPGAQYLRTDQTCPSLRQDFEGAAIYVAFFGPFASPVDACAARSLGPADAYVRVLSLSEPPTHVINCA